MVGLQSKFCILDPLKRPVNQFTTAFAAKKVDSYFRYKKQRVLFVYILFLNLDIYFAEYKITSFEHIVYFKFVSTLKYKHSRLHKLALKS